MIRNAAGRTLVGWLGRGRCARAAAGAVVERLERRRMFVTVSGAGFVDANANGVLDGNDSAFLPGMTVYDDANHNGRLDVGEPNSTTSIQSQGGWSLNLLPGRHLLRANMPAGYQFSAPTEGALWVDVQPGRLYFIRFGAWRTGRHGVNFYRDNNGNGMRETDIDFFSTGKAVWADLDDDGVMDAEEPGAAADWAGFASINLRPGTYRLRFTRPEVWSFTSPSSGSLDMQFNSLTVRFPDHVGMAGQSIVRGFVFDDHNGNEVYDSFESPREGVLAHVDLNGNARLDAGEEWALSDADGRFGFLMPFGSDATVYVRHPLGEIIAARSLATDREYNWEHDLVAAVRPAGRISGNLYADLDGSGARNGDEPFLPSRTVWADLDDDGELDAGEPSTQTGFAGDFRVGAPEGWVRVRTLEGDGYTFGPSGSSMLVQVLGRQPVYSGEMGLLDSRPTRPRSGAFGFVFNDLDRNGRQDPGERGVPGRTVYADENNNGALDVGERTAVSDTAGYYTITELSTTRTYILRDAGQPGWEQVYVGNSGGNSVTFGTNTAFGDRHVPLRESDPATAPFIARAWFDRELGHDLNVRFGRDVRTTIGKYDFVIRRVETGQSVAPPEGWQLQTSMEDGVTVVKLQMHPRLPDGRYEMILRAGAVADISGKANTEEFILPFQVLGGDANGDGKVSIADYLRIDRGMAREAFGFSNGDFDYSGAIDAADYFIIDSAYLNSLPDEARGRGETAGVTPVWPFAVAQPAGERGAGDGDPVEAEAPVWEVGTEGVLA